MSPFVPEIVTVVAVETALVVTVKFAVVVPATAVTFAGTVATFVLLLESLTVVPAAGAEPLKVMVPVDGLPPTTVDGFKLKEDNLGGVMVKVAFLITPL